LFSPVAPSLFFLTYAPIPNSNGTPTAGLQNTWWELFVIFLTEIAIYLGNGMRQANKEEEDFA